MSVTLGISVGTRFIGIALFKSNTLLYWHTKSFPSKWSEKKFRRIIKCIDELIAENNASSIAIKIPQNFERISRINRLLGAINILCERARVTPRYFTLDDVKRSFIDQHVDSKVLVAQITHTYPELTEINTRNKHAKTNYYKKVFEAVLVGHVVHKQNEAR